jgi:hypothetical protein
LDEDVVALVEGVSDGYSLTAATNRVLRRVLAVGPPPALEPADGYDDAQDGSQDLVGPHSGAERDVEPRFAPNVRSSVRRARTFSHGCTHPLARRYGDRCASCGATISR